MPRKRCRTDKYYDYESGKCVPYFEVGDLVVYEGSPSKFTEPHGKVMEVYPDKKSILVKDLKTSEEFEEVFDYFGNWTKEFGRNR